MGVARPQAACAQSVLSSGTWSKLGITEKGIYKIDFNLLQSLGFNPATLNPSFIQLYGQAGGMLPQKNSTPRPNDPPQNALYGVGLEDGKFDSNDYLLFYAQGPDRAVFGDNNTWIYEQNLYADTAYYFLTVGSMTGKRMVTLPNQGATHPPISKYSDSRVHEADLENILSSGREWFGEFLANSNPVSLNFQNIPVLVPNSTLKVIASVLNRGNQEAAFTVTINGVPAGSFSVAGAGTDTYDPRGVDHVDTLLVDQTVLGNPNSFEVVISYQGAGNARGNLNYAAVLFESQLQLTGKSREFTAPSSTSQSTSTFNLNNADINTRIWDITVPTQVAIQEYSLVNGQAVFGASSQPLRRYIAFSGGDFPLPAIKEQLPNQDIKSYATPDLLIVTHPSWRAEAERLAAFRVQNDQLRVEVVTPQEIYNEFSSGAQDVTAIRDYLKYLRDKDPVLKNLLLFGRCSFDYKNITEDNTNFVPTYQSRNSLDPIFSHNSDDYFAFLDPEEGEWLENLSGSGGHIMDIGVGRLPVTTNEEARTVVDKLIHYASDPAALGSWRQDIYYIADDGDFNLHQRDADQLATMVDTTNQDFNVKKIFLDAFPQQQTANGETAAGVNQAIEEAIEKGALIINYTGHGSEFRWAEETILNHAMINSWENYNRLPFFVTATCEFGRHDDPKRISGAEKLLTNPKGGAIGLVTTARPVFASKNFILNKAFYETALDLSENGYPTLGEIFKFVKNDSYALVANRNFVLLGDPSMKLAYPKYNLIITEVLKDQIPGDTLEALSLVQLSGKVVNAAGDTLSQYNGTAEVTVFDKETLSETLGSDGGRTFTFKERKSTIFRGLASIEQGNFTVRFVVPKNISYKLDRGKISLYGISNSGLMDAGGATISLVIGGSNKNAPPDNTPPLISLYMDDISFRTRGSTGTNTVILAKLSDENGINITNTGFGQDIKAILNSEQTFILNDFYRSDLDTYQSGWVTYPLNNLKEGNYHLTLKAWDAYNNSSESSLEFVVIESSALAIHKVINFPNPFQVSTTFEIDHNQAGNPLEVEILIFDSNGQLVNRLGRQYAISPSTLDDINWQGTNYNGAPLKSGLYLYKVIIRSTTHGDKSEEYRKLVLIK